MQGANAIEIMVLQTVDGFLVKGLRFAGAAKGAVIHVTSGAACDLAEFAGIKLAVLETIEFAGGSKGHMVHIHVEAHADGVGCYDVIHITRLIEGHLRITGAGRQGAENHCRTAILTSDEFGHGINHFSGEGDDGRSSWKPCHFLDARIGELRETGP